MSSSDTEVAVVGGGAAGVAAARHLHDAGVRCLIVEARDRLGGRAYTITARDGLAIDVGCGWLHSAERNPWSKVAAGQGRTVDKSAPPWSKQPMLQGFPGDAQQEFFGTMERLWERVDEAAELQKDGPVSDLLEPGNRWNNLIITVGTYITGAEFERVSIYDLAAYRDDSMNWRIAEGYGTTIAAHADGVPRVFSAPVTRIDHSGKRLRIDTLQGAIAADQAIVAVPSTIIAADEELFAPALPHKTEAAAGLPLGLADKLFLSLQGAEEFDKDSRLFGNTERLGSGAYQFRPFGREQIECYFAGSLAAELERGGEKAFFEFARDEMTAALGHDFARRIAPIGLHCWTADPFARGSYSYALPGQAGARAVLAEPVDDRLFFAGEACSLHDFSTAHGGYFTGVAAAEQVIAARQGSPARKVSDGR